MGNSCYLNSVLQLICTVDPFINYVCDRKNEIHFEKYKEVIEDFKAILEEVKGPVGINNTEIINIEIFRDSFAELTGIDASFTTRRS